MRDFTNRNPRRTPRRAHNATTDQPATPFDSFFDSPGRTRRDQKTAQLCRQAFRALSLAMAEAADDVVRELLLHDVTPAPDAARLLVRVGLPAGVTPADALDRLARAAGFLRREVAAAITRKRAPELLFLPIPTGEVPQ